MVKSDSIKELTAALADAQIAFLPIKRTEKVDYQTVSGRKKYDYAPLGAIIDATKKGLSDNGLAVTQATKLSDGNTVLETLLSHSSGEWLSGELYIGKQDMPPQSLGSALTYMRRYGMSAILCVSSEDDDDGEGAIARESPAGGSKSLEKETKDALKVKIEEALTEIDPLNWQVVRPLVEKLMASKKKGWETTALILTTLKGQGANSESKTWQVAYESLNGRGKQQFIDLVKAESPSRHLENAVRELGGKEV